MYYYICCLSGGQKKTCRICKNPSWGKTKKTTGNLGRDQDKRASSRTELNVQNYTFFGANTEDRVTSSGYQLLYILLTSLDRPLGNTTMNRNECTFLLTAFRWKVLIYSIAIIIIITIIIIIMAS